MIQNKFVNTLIIERIKREIPSSMGQKLHSYQENRMQGQSVCFDLAAHHIRAIRPPAGSRLFPFAGTGPTSV